MAPLPDRAYCAIKYFSIHGRFPDLVDPRRFTERIQVRKLRDRNPLYPRLADKIACKGLIAARVGSERVVPTLWAGTDLASVDWSAIPLPVVAKPSHASGVGRLLLEPDDVEALLAANPSRDWLAIDHARFNREWAYREIVPRILVEPAYLVDGQLPVDYRLYVFGGEVSHIEVDFTLDGARRYDSYSPEWQKLDLRDPDSVGHYEGRLDPPAFRLEMLRIAERLAAGLDFVRIDFLASSDWFFVGEMTLYPGGGFDRFEPASFDLVLGERWRRATASDGAQAPAEGEARRQSASRSR